MFKLVQEAYQQIIYERQHPYASAGSQSYGNTNTGSNTTYANGQGYNGQNEQRLSEIYERRGQLY